MFGQSGNYWQPFSYLTTMQMNEPKECPKFHLGESQVRATLLRGALVIARVLVCFGEKPGYSHSGIPTDGTPLDKIPQLPIILKRLDSGASMNLRSISLCGCGAHWNFELESE